MQKELINWAREIKADGSIVKVLKCRVAKINIEIDCLYGHSFGQFRPYLHEFSIPDIIITISQEEIDREKKTHPELIEPNMCIDNENVAITFDYGFLEPLVALKKIADDILQFDTFLIHGATVEKDGFAYVFVAPSGVGKTTRISIWKTIYPESTIVNGDKPFIRITETQVLACGTPWCGKEGWNTNTTVPLRAVFLLERADEGEESSIEEVSIGKAFPFLLRQTHCPQSYDLMRKTIVLLKSLEGRVKIFKFRSKPTEESVRLAYEKARP